MARPAPALGSQQAGDRSQSVECDAGPDDRRQCSHLPCRRQEEGWSPQPRSASGIQPCRGSRQLGRERAQPRGPFKHPRPRRSVDRRRKAMLGPCSLSCSILDAPICAATQHYSFVSLSGAACRVDGGRAGAVLATGKRPFERVCGGRRPCCSGLWVMCRFVGHVHCRLLSILQRSAMDRLC